MRRLIGTRLLHIRAGKTLPEMAKVMGVSPRTYSYYEQGERVPDGEALASLVLEGWNANWLLTGEGPERLADSGSVTESPSGSQPLRDDFLTIALELGDKATEDLDWVPRAAFARLIKEFYEAQVEGATYGELWQHLQKRLNSEPGGDASSELEQGKTEQSQRRVGGGKRRG